MTAPVPVVTGVGAVSCLGDGIDAMWEGMLAGRSAPRPVPDADARMAHPNMYLVPDRIGGGTAPSAARLGVLAAEEALAHAGLTMRPEEPAAVVLGTGMGQSTVLDRARSHGRPPSNDDAVFATAAEIADALGAHGPNLSISNACAAGGFAISVAADMIRSGQVEVAIAGGAEAYSRVALGCFNRLGAVDPERCRPFSAARAGTVFGEGAAMLVLESADHARDRGARPWASVNGAGWSCDAYHATAPEPDGAQIRRAVTEALERAGAEPADVAAVVPHGTGTELNDQIEGRVLAEVLTDRPPAYSLKALLGHTGGAAGALAVAAAVLMRRHGAVPANVEVGPIDPDCDIRLPEAQAPLGDGQVMVNAYAFGGNNVSLLIGGPR
ncbi:beta-ketoacyl-[acyl-carrier-protein] synthase family protein [Glycomyces halotolerans]